MSERNTTMQILRYVTESIHHTMEKKSVYKRDSNLFRVFEWYKM